MNQQQRAGKHPSFLRDRKPYRMKKETFHKKPNTPVFNTFRDRRYFDKKSKVTQRTQRSIFALDFYQNIYYTQLALTLYYDTNRLLQPDYSHGVLQTLRIDIVTEEISASFTSVRLDQSMAQKFSSQKYRRVREHILHLAAQDAMVKANHGLVSRILPQVRNRKLIMCMLSKGASALDFLHFLQAIRLVYKDHARALELCLLEAVRHKRWSLAEKVLTGFEQGAEANKEPADGAKSLRISSKLLHLTLAKALELRLWGIIEACLNQGGTIATACAETGFDLNSRSGTTGKRILEDAIGRDDRNRNTVQALLQAGANPGVKNALGETVLHQVAKSCRWNLLTLLLQFRSEVDAISSKLSPSGDTLLHIVTREGQVDILQTLLLKGANPLVKDGGGNTLMMAAMEAEEGRENLIRVLIQSGMATHQAVVSQSLLASVTNRGEDTARAFHSPMWTAVKTGQLRIAMMLYSSGACPAAEIQELATSLSIREKLEAFKRPDFLDFLQNISTHPRSLLDTCILQISHLIGCGPQRDVRAASLGLPDKLRGLVLQDHVVNPDFLKDCPPDCRMVSSMIFRGFSRVRLNTDVCYFRTFCGFDYGYDYDFVVSRQVFFSRWGRILSCSCQDDDH